MRPNSPKPQRSVGPTSFDIEALRRNIELLSHQHSDLFELADRIKSSRHTLARESH